MAGKCLGNAMKSLSHRIVHVQKCHFVQIFLETQGAFQQAAVSHDDSKEHIPNYTSQCNLCQQEKLEVWQVTGQCFIKLKETYGGTVFL